MVRMRGPRLTPAQKTDVWRRWRQGGVAVGHRPRVGPDSQGRVPRCGRGERHAPAAAAALAPRPDPGSPWQKSVCIRRATHPRDLRCSSFNYRRYFQSSRLVRERGFHDPGRPPGWPHRRSDLDSGPAGGRGGPRGPGALGRRPARRWAPFLSRHPGGAALALRLPRARHRERNADGGARPHAARPAIARGADDETLG